MGSFERPFAVLTARPSPTVVLRRAFRRLLCAQSGRSKVRALEVDELLARLERIHDSRFALPKTGACSFALIFPGVLAPQGAVQGGASELWSNIMIDANPSNTFRHLPLSPEQDAEIRHYITKKEKRGEPWDTSELRMMLKDMLSPPPSDEEGPESTVEETKLACEYALSSIDEAMESVSATEERLAAMEAEEMKHPRW